MRKLILAFALLLTPVMAAQAGVGVSIGINLGGFPELVPVPGYPVYYDPRIDGNYFFYDGLYWVYDRDGWYSSAWYDGPWNFVAPMYVPLFILRIPVRYYHRPPPYFRGWRDDEPPRWGQHWGRGWEERRRGWDHWDRREVPRPAPLPLYQREFSGDRYPRAVEQQRSIRAERYTYRPSEPTSRQQWGGQERSDRPPGAAPRAHEAGRYDGAGRPEQGNPRPGASYAARPEPRADRPQPAHRQADAPATYRPEPPRADRQPRQMPAPAPQRAAPPPREPAREAPRQQERGREPHGEPHASSR